MVVVKFNHSMEYAINISGMYVNFLYTKYFEICVKEDQCLEVLTFLLTRIL